MPGTCLEGGECWARGSGDPKLLEDYSGGVCEVQWGDGWMEGLGASEGSAAPASWRWGRRVKTEKSR